MGVILTVLLFINIKLTIFFVILALAFIVWHNLIKVSLHKSTAQVQDMQGDIYTFFFDHIAEIKHLKIFSLERRVLSSLEMTLQMFKQKSIQNAIMHYILRFSNYFVKVFALLIFIYCFYSIAKGDMSVGFFILFSSLLFVFIYPLSELVELGALIQQGNVAANRISEIRTKAMDSEGAVKLYTFSHSIELQNVSVAYGDEASAIEDITLSINKGEDIGIVGASGSGKTTLVHALVGVVKHTEGSILIDGNPLESYDIHSVRDVIGLLLQDTFLFNETIENSVDPMRTLQEGELEELLQQVKLNNFDNRMEELIGEDGEQLSGGERQRLALARFLAKKYELLIFDEATSQVDSSTGKHIEKTIAELRESNPLLTTITISHKLDTIKDKKKIVVLEMGKIVGIGDHRKLFDQCETYRAIFNQESSDQC